METILNHSNTTKGEDCIQHYDDCNTNDDNSSSLPPLFEQYASYNIMDQDIDDQIATINSLTISDQQHPMDTILDT